MEQKDLSEGARRLRQASDSLRLPRKPIPLQGGDMPGAYDDFEVEFYEDVLKADPCEEGSLQALGHAYTRRGDYQKGLEVDQRLARLRPDDPAVFYNLACSFSLLGRLDEAFLALDEAAAKGFRDLKMLMEDADLEAVRQDKRMEGYQRRLRLLGSDGLSNES